MNDNDEYSLHHEYSQSVTKEDQKSVTLIMDYILERGNPFNTDEPSEIININIATGEKVVKSKKEKK